MQHAALTNLSKVTSIPLKVEQLIGSFIKHGLSMGYYLYIYIYLYIYQNCILGHVVETDNSPKMFSLIDGLLFFGFSLRWGRDRYFVIKPLEPSPD